MPERQWQGGKEEANTLYVEEEYEEKVVMMSLALKNMSSSSIEQLCIGGNWVFVP